MIPPNVSTDDVLFTRSNVAAPLVTEPVRFRFVHNASALSTEKLYDVCWLSPIDGNTGSCLMQVVFQGLTIPTPCVGSGLWP